VLFYIEYSIIDYSTFERFDMKRSTSHLEYALLGLLARTPAHGYELNKQLKTLPALGRVWYLKQANLYALLDKLEGQGLIEVQRLDETGYPPRKIYALTSAGEKALSSWVKMPVDRPREMRQEFLLRLYFARQHSHQAASELLEKQRQILEGWLEEIQKSIADLPPEETFQNLVLEYRLRLSVTTIGFLDWCERQPFLQK
jgi:PadR family transcriptional regulator AphA